MSRVATITLYLDPQSWEDETGEKMDDLAVLKIGKVINDEVAAGWAGYSGWHTGWAEFREDGFVSREFVEAHDIEGGEEVVNS